MNQKYNVIGWVEIPVTDMDRATKFYETVLDMKLENMELGPVKMAMFPSVKDAPGSTGALVQFPDFYKPSSEGPFIYFSSQHDDLSVELERVEAAGGKILFQKTLIKEDIGYMGVFIDTEGNRVALHSIK